MKKLKVAGVGAGLADKKGRMLERIDP